MALLAMVLAAAAAGSAPAAGKAGAPVLLYASDWSGRSEIYAVDPSARRPPAQVTFGGRASCAAASDCAGFVAPSPSPDGRRLVFSAISSHRVCPQPLFTAGADGRGLERLSAKALCHRAAAWAPDSRRLAVVLFDPVHYAAIHVVNADGSGDRFVDYGDQPAWSPDGKSLAYVRYPYASSDPSITRLEVVRGRVKRTVGTGSGGFDFAWSPTGKWIAYVNDALFVVRPDGTRRRRLIDGPQTAPAWSADGRYLAYSGHDGLVVAETVGGATRVVSAGLDTAFAWSPRGHVLALGSTQGLELVDATGGVVRRLSRDRASALAWDPDGRSIAYIVDVGLGVFPASDVRVTDLAGHSRTVVAARGAYGGHISGLVWTRLQAARYRPAAGRTIATIEPDEVTPPWPVTQLVADGDRVAYSACGHVFVWTPAARAVVQADPAASMWPNCTLPTTALTPFFLYSLALAGDRVAYAAQFGQSGKSWGLVTQTLAPDEHAVELASAAGLPRAGELVGSGQLLAFSWWSCSVGGSCTSDAVTQQSILRIRAPGTCRTGIGIPRDTPGPCQKLVSQPGPLTPLDVDTGRIAAGGSNATWLLDPDGKLLLSIPVSPLAAQLGGTDLVVLLRGELRDYDSGTGVLEHSWPLPDVTAGRDCTNPDGSTCRPAALVLEDVARGFAAYTLDHHVHLLRLADGEDLPVASGTLARFMDGGLVYSDGPRIHLVPYDQLPLR